MRIVTIIAGATLLLVSSCKDEKKQSASAQGGARPQNTMTVVGYIVKTGPVSEPIQLPGSLLPMEETQIQAEVSGRVVSHSINEGAYVNKGALLVKLFDGDLQAQLKKLEVQLQIAEKTEERNKELLKISGISQQDYDLSFLQVSNIKADIELLRTNIVKTEIRAPFSGKIGFRNISIGAYITPATIITNLRQLSQMKLQFSVPEKYTSKIRMGQSISFSVEGSTRKFLARVYASESTVSETTRGLNVRCMVQQNDASLVPGSFAKVDMDFAKNDNAILVPSQAILPQARGKKLILYRDGVAKFVDVQTGIRDSANVEIIGGVIPGDTIITTGLLGLKPDAKVKLSKVQK
ncbi:efflux RND transporter periplasmic adaptor subunit [Lacibacter sp. H407]|uniref:efflux RND transporter periplasmic adaptor subunit n=1 Tax=Lacibacter sp. H407 TaxID=3133423 RepID=UPI0030BB5958